MFQLSNLKVVHGNTCVLSIPQCEISSSKLTVIMGHNGSGKSTLMKVLAGQQRPTKGKISIDGRDIHSLSSRALAQHIAFLPQHLPQGAGLTVRELVKLGRFPWQTPFKSTSKIDERIVEQAMCDTGVLSFSDVEAERLSGGERQRAWVAMLLAQQSPVLLLDEPTSALDVHYQYQLMALLKDANRAQGKGVVVILHDINLALRFADHILVLERGEVAFLGESTALSNEDILKKLFRADIRLINHPTQTSKVAIICE